MQNFLKLQRSDVVAITIVSTQKVGFLDEPCRNIICLTNLLKDSGSWSYVRIFDICRQSSGRNHHHPSAALSPIPTRFRDSVSGSFPSLGRSRRCTTTSDLDRASSV